TRGGPPGRTGRGRARGGLPRHRLHRVHRSDPHRAGWARPVPGLALDSLGNPQLATFDMATEQVVLISCLDSGCTKTTTVPLQEFEEEPALTALTLDQDDRPHLVWAQGTPYLRSTRDFSAEAEYVHCLQPRCGADGMFFAADPVAEEA